MIKIIHYCWFGGKKKPKNVKKCIKSWKKYFPDFAIVEWNERNCSIKDSPLYVQQAYELKKYAFVADYFRFKVLYENGGLYLDTDMQIIKNFANLLSCESLIGFGSSSEIAGGIIYSNVKSKIIKELLDSYLNSVFVTESGINLSTIVVRITNCYLKQGFQMNNTLQAINNNFVYPQEFFYAKDYFTHKITITKNTCAIHHYDGTWLSSKERFIAKQPRWVINFYKRLRHVK